MGEVRLASAGDDVKLWNCNGFSLMKQFNPHSHNVSSLCWAHDNSSLATASSCGDKVVLTYSGAQAYTSDLAVGDGRSVIAFNSTSRYIMAGGSDGNIHVWDLKTMKLKKSYKDHQSAITVLQFNWNDTVIASGAESGEIILYNVVTGVASSPLILPKSQAVRQLQYSHFKKSLLAACYDSGAVALWDAARRRLQHEFAGAHRAPATAIAFSPLNEMLLMSAGLDRRIVCYDVHNKQTVKTLTADSPLTSIALMHDGATLAAGSARGHIYIYDLRQGASPLNTLHAHSTAVHCLHFQHSLDAASKKMKSSSSKNTSSAVKPPESTNGHNHPAADEHIGSHNQHQGGDEMFSPIRENILTPGGTSVQQQSSSSTFNGRLSVPTGRVSAPTGRASYSGVSDPMFSPLQDDGVAAVRSHPIGRAADVSPSFHTSRPTASQSTDGAVTTSRPESRPAWGSPSGRSESRPRGESPSSRPRSLPPASAGAESPQQQAATSSESPTLRHHRAPDITITPDDAAPSAGVETTRHAAFESASARRASVEIGAGAAAGDAGSFQHEFVRRVVEDAMDEVREQMRRDVLNLHMDMLKQFQLQQAEICSMLQQFSVNDQLMAENDRLREENKRLKKLF